MGSPCSQELSWSRMKPGGRSGEAAGIATPPTRYSKRNVDREHWQAEDTLKEIYQEKLEGDDVHQRQGMLPESWHEGWTDEGEGET